MLMIIMLLAWLVCSQVIGHLNICVCHNNILFCLIQLVNAKTWYDESPLTHYALVNAGKVQKNWMCLERGLAQARRKENGEKFLA